MTAAELKTLSHNGKVYRSFGCAIAVRDGMLAMMPLHAIDGRFNHLEDGCPVDWREAVEVLNARTDGCEPVNSEDLNVHLSRSARDVLSRMGMGWRLGVLPRIKAIVFESSEGLRLAMAADMALAQPLV